MIESLNFELIVAGEIVVIKYRDWQWKFRGELVDG